MKISEIKDKELRELAELRDSEYKGIYHGDNLVFAFDWEGSPEKYDFWHGVNNGIFTSLPKTILKSLPEPTPAESKMVEEMLSHKSIKEGGVLEHIQKLVEGPLRPKINISLKDWEEHAPLGCYISGTIISMNGKKCDNIYSGGDVKAALEFVLTELGYEVNIDEI
jgi:hypothetical protein